MTTRNRFILLLVAAGILVPALWLLYAGNDEAQVADPDKLAPGDDNAMVVYMSPQCGCCVDWVDYLEDEGFTVESRKTNAVNQIKEEAGLPRDLVSCHTGFIAGYLIEGHVPASDIRRLLDERPEAAGLSVPRMPIGSPGMEMEGHGRDAFDVVLFNADGSREVYNHYPATSAL